MTPGSARNAYGGVNQLVRAMRPGSQRQTGQLTGRPDARSLSMLQCSKGRQQQQNVDNWCWSAQAQTCKAERLKATNLHQRTNLGMAAVAQQADAGKQMKSSPCQSSLTSLTGGGGWQADARALETSEAERSEAAATLERRLAAMEASLAARRAPREAPAAPAAARGPGAEFRYSKAPHQIKGFELPINLNDVAARCASGLVLAKDACSWRGWVCASGACTTPVRDPKHSGLYATSWSDVTAMQTR